MNKFGKKEQSVSIDENEYTDCTCEEFSKRKSYA